MTDSTLEDELKSLRGELAAAIEESEHVIYVVSHDLRAPLRMVVSFTELLEEHLRDQLDEEGRKYIDRAIGGARQMQQMVADLLAYSRIGRASEDFEMIIMDDLWDDVVAEFGASIEQAGAQVVRGQLGTAFGSRVQIRLVLFHLIDNALKFRGEAPPAVHIKSEPQGERMVFAVSDNGIGFEMRFAKQILQVFQRLHGQGTYPGTGIGLALCSKVIQRHGGVLTCQSTPNHGASFSFTLPTGPQ